MKRNIKPHKRLHALINFNKVLIKKKTNKAEENVISTYIKLQQENLLVPFSVEKLQKSARAKVKY